MRIVTDIDEARRLLTRRAAYAEPVLPPAAAKRTEAIFGEPLSATEAVRRILTGVRERGDDAVRDYAKRIDGDDRRELEVSRGEWDKALRELPADIADALRTAAARIRAYAEASMPRSWHDEDAGYGQRTVPIERVGLYVPGGSAAYPSTVLMSAIPAKVAGVPEIVVCTPDPSPATLAAAAVAGADRLFAVGGAQAIAALAYGTATVPQVDKICGPGNVFVSIAKREVYGQVDIDGLYGPTETMVIADETADPVIAAADLLAQAEHDELASPVLVATAAAVAERIAAEVDRQLAGLDRRAIASAAVERNGVAVVAGSVGEAIELANAFAPEHLCLLVRDAASYVDAVRNAGGIFVGEHSPEVLGDYVAGPSHVMPTGGTARFASSLGVQTFLRYQPVVQLNEATLTQIGPAAAALARTEGLTAHARAVELRLEGKSALRKPREGR